jgi:hypothetical protein
LLCHAANLEPHPVVSSLLTPRHSSAHDPFRLASVRPVPLFGPGKGTIRHLPWCDTTAELDRATLVWARGADMPLEILHERLRCQKYGNRKIVVYFDVPNQPQSARAGR